MPRQAPFTVAGLLDMLGEFGPERLPQDLTPLDERALVDNLRELGPESLLKSLAVPPRRDIIWEIAATPENPDAGTSGHASHDPASQLAVPRQANGVIHVR